MKRKPQKLVESTVKSKAFIKSVCKLLLGIVHKSRHL